VHENQGTNSLTLSNSIPLIRKTKMTPWMEYVKASYDLIMDAQSRSGTILDYDVGAFVVHTFAKYMATPISTEEPVATKLLTAVNMSGELRKIRLLEVCEECVLIDGLDLNRRRWVSGDYYRNMGIIAAEQRAWSDRPPDELYIRVAQQFSSISTILHCIRSA
jgi:hypothetical protein